MLSQWVRLVSLPLTSGSRVVGVVARLLITQQLPDDSFGDSRLHNHEITYRTESTPMTSDELRAAVDGIDAVVCTLSDRINADVIDKAGALKVIANVAVGYDNIDVATASARGIVVTNTPGVLDASTADIAILLMLATRRRSSEREQQLRQGKWGGWGVADDLALDLTGATLGLVGYGRIARAVAKRAEAFEMNVLHHTRHNTEVAGWVSSLHELANSVDVLSIHVPSTPSTFHLVDASVVEALQPSSVLINTARGAVLDEEAVARALNDGRIWGAGFDVYDGEPSVSASLLASPHTVLLPHIGSATLATRQAMSRLALSSALDVLSGTMPPTRVQF